MSISNNDKIITLSNLQKFKEKCDSEYSKKSEASTVVANPSGEGTADLEKLQVGNTIYNIPSGEASTNSSPVLVKEVGSDAFTQPINFTDEEIETLKNTDCLIIRIKDVIGGYTTIQDQYFSKRIYTSISEVEEMFMYDNNVPSEKIFTLMNLIISNNIGNLSSYKIDLISPQTYKSKLSSPIAADSVGVVEFTSFTTREGIIIASVMPLAHDLRGLIFISQPYYSNSRWCVNIYNKSTSAFEGPLEITYYDYN